MKLSGFDLFRYSIPLAQTVVLKNSTIHRREGLLLKLSGSDGSEGWGESAPLPGFSRESLGESAAQLRRLAESMTGQDLTDDRVDGYAVG